MTERREPPRIGTADGRPLPAGEEDSGRSAPRRLGRLVASPAARRLVLSRVGRAALIGLAVAVLTVAVGSSLWRGAVDWLHRRPEYQVWFRDIRLVPDPPPWIKGGREALLRDVQAGRQSLESFSILDANLDDLLDDFRRNPWVVRATRVVRVHPNTLRVELDYREPVATVLVGDSPYPVDGEAVVLPRDGVDPARAAPLVEISVPRPPEEPTPGLPWPSDRSRPGTPPILLATHLARFLKDRSARDPDLADRLRFKAIVVSKANRQGDRENLWLLDTKGTYLLWGDLAKLGTPIETITDDNKWDQLRGWVEQKRAAGPEQDRGYFWFGPRGIEPGRFRSKVEPDPPDPSGRNRGAAVPLR